MVQSQIFLPCVALVVLTAMVWIRLYVERIGEMRARRIRPQVLASAREVTQALQNVNAADNFRNLFEVPVLFYVLCISLAVTQLATPLDILAAWSFVALRAAHSLIHLRKR
ncbi:MAG: MAPEG family protein [Gallionella sp.]